MKILNVVGARPNFMKVAPLHRAFLRHGGFASLIIHTGQHYDEKMSEVFFRQLELPPPDLHLGVGGGSHAQQTARIMIAFEQCLVEQQPDLVLVVGDVNSTMACSLVAAKCLVPVAHIEAGLRSGDRTMPEEINRLVTDRISDLLFVTEQSGLDHLRAEGVPAEKIHFVGNVMIDSLAHFRERARRVLVLEELKLRSQDYLFMTMHRPVNVDSREGLAEVLSLLARLTDRIKVVFPMHPRILKRMQEFGFAARLEALPNLLAMEPVGYLECLKLMENAAVVITDSGGIQEETTYLRVPCLTLRETTERPITIELGTNELLSLDAELVFERVMKILAGDVRPGRIPPLWDGHAAERIVSVLSQWLENRGIERSPEPMAVNA